jgi:hypothetical protein
MNTPTTDRLKVCCEHQQRVAYVYVRQSSMRQVHNNVESQKLQYGFAEQAAQLGWSSERIIVVDEDQARPDSGAGPYSIGHLGGRSARNHWRLPGYGHYLSRRPMLNLSLQQCHEPPEAAASMKESSKLHFRAGLYLSLDQNLNRRSSLSTHWAVRSLITEIAPI